MGELADIFGVTDSAVSRWRTGGVVEFGIDNRVDVAHAVAMLMRNPSTRRQGGRLLPILAERLFELEDQLSRQKREAELLADRLRARNKALREQVGQPALGAE
jgi:hypothetical protein